MSIARGFGLNGKSLYTNVAKPMDVNLTFTVDPANANGLGVSSVKSNGYVRNVFMHTTSTPGSNQGALNPNPAVGYALIQLNNAFNVFLGQFDGLVSTLSGTPLTATAAVGAPYVITALGTATLAQWQAVGLPMGVTPAVGVPFIATAAATIGGSAAVQAPVSSNINQVSVVGNAILQNTNVAANGGAYVMLQFAGPTSSSVTTPIATQPTAGSIVQCLLKFDGSTVTVDGL